MRSKQNGVALVELALIIPLLLLLTFITTEFGRAMFEYNAVTKITEARNLMVYGNLAGTGTPLARGLTLTNVPAGSCCIWQTAGTNPVVNTVTVRVSSYTFRPLFSSVLGIAFGDANGNIVFSDITATMRAAT